MPSACASRISWGISGSMAMQPEMWKPRSEEHTSELQSRGHLVCRLLLEKKKKKIERREVRPLVGDVELSPGGTRALISRTAVWAALDAPAGLFPPTHDNSPLVLMAYHLT